MSIQSCYEVWPHQFKRILKIVEGRDSNLVDSLRMHLDVSRETLLEKDFSSALSDYVADLLPSVIDPGEKVRFYKRMGEMTREEDGSWTLRSVWEPYRVFAKGIPDYCRLLGEFDYLLDVIGEFGHCADLALNSEEDAGVREAALKQMRMLAKGVETVLLDA